MAAAPCKVLMVYPRFSPGAFWNTGEAMSFVGAQRQAPPLGLITVAAMLPSEWQVRLVDRNFQTLQDGDLDWADMVMTGGMLPQQRDTLDLIQRIQARGKPVVVGGPDITSSPHLYESADIRVLGEAEVIIHDVIAAWRGGERSGTFEAEKFKVDVTTTPVPRFDLINFADYYHVGVQFSRGCPFTCEFCDIIELYGRVPRVKDPDQILNELDTLRRAGHRGLVDFVDDNLIGNKKALKQFLPKLIDWQKQHGYPFQFSTEASLNLADDPQLLDLMSRAMFYLVFLGIESPDPDVLVATQKKQNTRRDIAESLQRIYAGGMFAIGGFIVGFDDEPAGIAEPFCDLIEEGPIAICMVGLLTALPNTQLTRRLTREGRLHADNDVAPELGDQCLTGLNFDTQRPRVDILTDYVTILENIYSRDAYFTRVEKICHALRLDDRKARDTPRNMVHDLRVIVKFLWVLHARQRSMIGPFWRTVARCVPRNPRSIMAICTMVAFYAHLGPFSRFVVSETRKQIDDIKARGEPQVAHVQVPEKEAARAAS